MPRFGRRRRKVPKPHSGTVYVLRIMLDDIVTYKVGITTFSVTRRVLQIIEGIYKGYGYFPEVRIVREDKTKNHFKVETAIHNQLMDYSYTPLETFTGSSELFRGLEEAELIEKYELAISSDEPAEIDKRLHVW